MFLKKRHLEILSYIANSKTKEETERAFPEEFDTCLLELYILGFVDSDFKLSESGKKLVELITGLKKKIEDLPEIFADTEIIKMVELGIKTDYLLENWSETLEERGLAENGKVNESGKKLLEIYKETHPMLYVTQDILKLLSVLPEVGEIKELVAIKDRVGVGDNVLNALQAMRMLLISPFTSGKAFSITEAARLALKLSNYVSGSVILSAEEAELLKSERGKEEVIKKVEEKGMWDGGVTELGKLALETYDAMGVEKKRLSPVYLLDEEIRVINAIAEIERIHKNTPSILPTYSEIEKRAKVEDLGALLHLLESKEIVRRKYMEGKDTYWLTEWKKLASMGCFTSDGVKAITFALSNDVPAVEWVRKAKEEGLIKNGITAKGKAVIDFAKNYKRKPFLTKYDVILLTKMPRKYVHRKELEEISVAICECEAKGLVEELQNGTVGLTELGREVKNVVELAKTEEMLAVKFPVTPTTYNVLKVIHENLQIFNKMWKESTEERNYKQDEVDFIKKRLSLSDEEIKKALTLLRVTGLLGRRSITEAGKKLVELYNST